MTIRETYDIFSNLWDKYRDEGVTPAEFSRHINTAQVLVLKDHWYSPMDPTRTSEDHNPKRAFENTIYDVMSWKKLLVPYPDLTGLGVLPTSSSDGQIGFGLLQFAFPLDTIRDEGGIIQTRRPEVFTIVNVARWSLSAFVSCQWMRHNEYRKYLFNSLYGPTDAAPWIVVYDTYMQFYPLDAREVEITLCRMPLHVWYDPNNAADEVNPELPDAVMYDVILRALTLAGINMKDDDLYKMSQEQEGRQ